MTRVGNGLIEFNGNFTPCGERERERERVLSPEIGVIKWFLLFVGVFSADRILIWYMCNFIIPTKCISMLRKTFIFKIS